MCQPSVRVLVLYLSHSSSNVCPHDYEWSHWSRCGVVDVCVVTTRWDHTDYWPDPDSGPALPCLLKGEALLYYRGQKTAHFIAFS